MARVPFIDLARVVREFATGVEDDWRDCLDKTQFVGGPRVDALEAALSKELGLPHTVACANGTDAIAIALRAIGVAPGAKVAIPNLTFWATYEAVEAIGAIPVLVDVDADDLQLSYDELRRAQEAHRLDAAILVHLYGWASARTNDIRTYCREHGVRLLEDGAQCFGTLLDRRPVLEGADAATLSFYPAKVIGGAMDGGAMLFRSEEAAKIARSIANHGRSSHYSYAYVGQNSRMGGIQAAFLLRMVAHAAEIVAQRRRAAERYRELLRTHSKLRIYAPPSNTTENGYLSVLAAPNAEAIAAALKERGIGTGRVYPETMDSQPPATRAIRAGDLAVSRSVCERVFSPPLFYGITDAEIDASVAAIREVVS